MKLPPISHWDIPLIVRLVLHGGAIGLRRQAELNEHTVSQKTDNSVVTDADEEIELLFEKELRMHAEGLYFIGEETLKTHDSEYLQRALDETTWIIDPIDGTLPYANRLPHWGISLALLHERSLREGVIFLPASRDLLITNNGTLLYAKISADPSEWESSSPQVVKQLKPLTDVVHSRYGGGLLGAPQELAKWGTYNGYQTLQAVGSCVYNTIQFLLGNYNGYIIKAKLWDVAAMMAMLDCYRYCIQTLEREKQITNAVDPQTYHLNLDEPQCWMLRSPIIIAPSVDDCIYIRRHTKIYPRY